MFGFACGRLMADKNDHRNYEYTYATFSNCGSFCTLDDRISNTELLSSFYLSERQAETQIPAVWNWRTSYNGRLYSISTGDETTMIHLHQAIDRPHRNGLYDSLDTLRKPEHTITVNITVIPAHLVLADIYLLVGESGDGKIRILFLPTKGPPEIKHLRVTMNQILAKMEEIARAIEPDVEKLFREEDDLFEQMSRDGVGELGD